METNKIITLAQSIEAMRTCKFVTEKDGGVRLEYNTYYFRSSDVDKSLAFAAALNKAIKKVLSETERDLVVALKDLGEE